MALQPGIWPAELPEGSTPTAVPAVRQAPLKKYQLLVVLAPVKSSLTIVCACAAKGSESAAAAASTRRMRRFIYSPVRLTTPCCSSYTLSTTATVLVEPP